MAMTYPDGYTYKSLLGLIKSVSRYVKSHETYYLKTKTASYEILVEEDYYRIEIVENKRSRTIAIVGKFRSSTIDECDITDQEQFDQFLSTALKAKEAYQKALMATLGQ